MFSVPHKGPSQYYQLHISVINLALPKLHWMVWTPHWSLSVLSLPLAVRPHSFLAQHMTIPGPWQCGRCMQHGEPNTLLPQSLLKLQFTAPPQEVTTPRRNNIIRPPQWDIGNYLITGSPEGKCLHICIFINVL